MSIRPITQSFRLFVLALFGGLLWLAAPAAAGDADSRVPAPHIERGKGKDCVADTAFMRRNHMRVLQHDRDDTMHRGVRPVRFSLKECVACHAVAGPDARPVGIDSPRHFCRSCHDYAAVSIDCFQCHAARPETGKTAHQPVPNGVAALQGIQWK